MTSDTSSIKTKRAPSLHLLYNSKEPGDILMQDVLVPASGMAKCTYYCCLNWNSGKEGGGYCGIQDHPDGRAFIFSIWDPREVKNVPITAVYKGPGTWTERFDGEGMGLKSMNFELGWKEDQWYTIVVRRWDAPTGEATHFGCWVHDHRSNHWTHLITMNYPVPSVYFTGTTVSFLEDWGFTSQNYRCVYYHGGFKRKLDFSWIPFSKADFQVNTYDIKNGTATENFSVCCHNPREGVCMASGGDATCSTGTNCSFEDAEHAGATKPNKQHIRLISLKLSGNKLVWDLDRVGMPQFMYRVFVGGHEVCCEAADVTEVQLDGDLCETRLNARGDCLVTLKVSDILGNNDVKSVNLNNRT